MNFCRYSIIVICVTLLGACGSQPSVNITTAPENDISLAEVLQSKSDFESSIVRWGGRILNVEEVQALDSHARPVLRIEVQEFPLDSQGQPLTSEPSAGRFIAMVQSPYSKDAYYRNRRITVIGSIYTYETKELSSGTVQYFPVLNVQEKYTWYGEGSETSKVWSRFFYSIGISKDNVGIGVVFY